MGLGDDDWKATEAQRFIAPQRPCLLYTSDAADERSSVDLGGRRIIKKKNEEHDMVRTLQRANMGIIRRAADPLLKYKIIVGP